MATRKRELTKAEKSAYAELALAARKVQQFEERRRVGATKNENEHSRGNRMSELTPQSDTTTTAQFLMQSEGKISPITSKPLKWHGGKHYLADRIIKLMPEHTHYVEPYAGGLSVLLAKPAELIKGHSEVVNDLNGGLSNFWDVLSSEELFSELKCRLESTPFSERIWETAALQNQATTPKEDMVDSAVRFFIQYRQSRQGLGKDFATLSRNRTRRGMNEQVSSWLAAVEGLPEAHERLKRVVVLNRDAAQVIQQQDGTNSFFYLDPPYLHETRTAKNAYEFEMSRDEHKNLLNVLLNVKGKFILSGYRSDLYDEFAQLSNWQRVDIQIDNKASSAKKKETKTECLWMNFVPQDQSGKLLKWQMETGEVRDA